jgi:hypothetical protein
MSVAHEPDWARSPGTPNERSVFSLRSLNTYDDKTRRSSYAFSDLGSEDEDHESCCCCQCDPILCWFRVFHFVASMVNLSCAGANVFVITKLRHFDIVTAKEGLIRSYAVLFCLACIFVEYEIRYFVRRLKFLENWSLRGLFYGFLGAITVNTNNTSIEKIELENVCGALIQFIGAVYFVLGLFCLRELKMRRHAERDGYAQV